MAWTDNCHNLDGAARVRLAGLDVLIPPLTLGQIKRLRPVLAKLSDLHYGAMLSEEELDAVLQVLTAAVRRNYPDVTADDLVEVIDLRNLKPVVEAVMGISGLASGEAEQGSPSTGAPSTGESSPSPAGPTEK